MLTPRLALGTVPVHASSRLRSEGWALAGLSLAMLMPSLDTSIANAALPVLAEAFHATFHQVQWIVLSYLVAITSLIVVAGRLGDLFGRRRLLLAGIAVFTAASWLCGIAATLPVMLAARAAQGLGASAMMALTVSFVADTVPKERAGRAMGLLGSMSAIGTMLGPSLGGALIASIGWRAIFLVNVPVGIVAFLVVQHSLPAVVRPAQPTLASAMLNASLFRHAALRTGLLNSGLVSSVMMATLVVGPFYLSRGLGLGPALVGFVLSVGPLVAALGGMPAGRLVDRFGAGRMTTAGLGGIAGGAAALALLPMHSGLAGYLAAIVAMTAGYALFQAANNTAVVTASAASDRGVTAGLLSLARNLGLITGAGALGAVFAHAVGSEELAAAAPEAVSAGMRITFAVATLLIAPLALAAARHSMYRSLR